MTWSERVTSWFQPDHWLPKTLFVVVVIFVVLTIIGFVIEKQREKDARKAIQRTALVKKFKEKYGVLNNDTRFYFLFGYFPRALRARARLTAASS